MCDHTLNGGRMVCTRGDADHDPEAEGGHTYAAAWAADRHDETEAVDD